MFKILLISFLIGGILGLVINWISFLINKKIVLILIIAILTVIIWLVTSLFEKGLNYAAVSILFGIILSLRTIDINIKRKKRIAYITLIIVSLLCWIILYIEVIEN